jgi:hypothetical protein
MNKEVSSLPCTTSDEIASLYGANSMKALIWIKSEQDGAQRSRVLFCGLTSHARSTLLVTGGNSGIGRGIVHRLAQEDARVAFVGRDRKKAENVIAELRSLKADAQFFAVDLSQESAVRNFMEDLDRKFGRLNIVVNDAGLGSRQFPRWNFVLSV